MALTVSITPAELKRQAALAFEGKSYRIFLASDPTSTLTTASTVLEWNALKLAAENGYQEVTGTIEAGSYNEASERYELPPLTAQFTSTGAGYAFDVVVIVVDNAEYPHSIIRLGEPQPLQSGQSKTFLISFIQDD